ncbi:MAG: polyprenyl diphosphate synthase [Nitrospira sp.]
MSIENIPECVGIIMDGNRRWAKANGQLSLQGHRAGGEKLKEVVTLAKDFGIKHIIFFAFSTENWKRGEEEVSYLLNLIAEYIHNEIEHFNKQGGILHCVGDISRFSTSLQEKLKDAEVQTKNNSGPHVYFALNYGGRQEIISAVKSIVKENPNIEDITDEYFAKHLQTYPMPDPDIIIRTSGEERLSGFLPWQGVYSELFFTKTLWPDFSKDEFGEILEEYSNRERRIGK